MKNYFFYALVLLCTTALSGSVCMSAESLSIGGDVYIGSPDSDLSNDAQRDVFVSGFSTAISGDVAQDAHALGFSVDVQGEIGANLYAAGSNVTVGGPIGEDLTVSGFTVNLEDESRVGGNARIGAGTVTINAPIKGSLIAAAGTIKLNAPINDDVQLSAVDINFGDNAKISGSLFYSAPEKIYIPDSVISPERVRYQQRSEYDIYMHLNDSVPQLWPSLVTRVTAAFIVLFFLLLLAAVINAFLPDTVDRLRQRAGSHAWRSLLFGFIGLSILIGAVPVSAITIIGIPLFPFVVLALILFWTLGYILGVYVIATRIWQSFEGTSSSMPAKLAVLAAGFIGISTLNYIPVIGWLINLSVMLLGLGAMTYYFLERLVAHENQSG